MNTSPYPIRKAMESTEPVPESDDLVNHMVNHPDHYTWHPTAECHEVVEEFPYNVGTAMAYLWRSGRKSLDPTEDIEKAIKHLEFECARLRARTQP